MTGDTVLFSWNLYVFFVARSNSNSISFLSRFFHPFKISSTRGRFLSIHELNSFSALVSNLPAVSKTLFLDTQQYFGRNQFHRISLSDMLTFLQMRFMPLHLSENSMLSSSSSSPERSLSPPTMFFTPWDYLANALRKFLRLGMERFTQLLPGCFTPKRLINIVTVACKLPAVLNRG